MPAKRFLNSDSPVDRPVKRGFSRTMLLQQPNRSGIITFSSSSLAPDVEITVFEDVYHMHSTNLRHNSAFFDKSLSESWWKEHNTHDSPDGIRYRYQLSLDKDTPELSMVEPVAAQGHKADAAELTVSGQPIDVSHSMTSTAKLPMSDAPPSPVPKPTHLSPLALQAITKNLRTAYSTLFRTFYNRSPDTSFLRLADIGTLVSLADQYCSLPHVAGTVELLLMVWARCHGRIHEQPIEVLLLANKIRSKILYNESFVHSVGRLDDYWGRKDELPPEVLAAVVEGYYKLTGFRTKVDREVAMIAVIHEGELSIFERNQLAEVFQRSRKDGEAELYRGIERIMSKKSRYRGSALMRNLQFLLGNELKIDNAIYAHLTCTQLEDQYPWNDAEDW